MKLNFFDVFLDNLFKWLIAAVVIFIITEAIRGIVVCIIIVVLILPPLVWTFYQKWKHME